MQGNQLVPETVDDMLVFSRHKLVRLHKRIEELQVENKDKRVNSRNCKGLKSALREKR